MYRAGTERGHDTQAWSNLSGTGSAQERPAAVEAADLVFSKELSQYGGERLVPDLERATELLLGEGPRTFPKEVERLLSKARFLWLGAR